MPLVSVILPTRDRPALLPRAVGSVLAQTLTDLEVIVVDNNTTEPPVRQAHAGAEWLRDPRVRIVSGGNADTAGAARNAGLAEARGAWITYLDDDDAYRPEKLARQMGLAEKTGSPIVLCGAAYHLAGRVRHVQCDSAKCEGDELLLRAVWGTPFLLHRAGAERFDATLRTVEDLEFGLRLAERHALTVVPIANEPLVDVYPQPGPRVNTAAASRRAAAARVLALPGKIFSRAARRRYVLRLLLTQAKLAGRFGRCVALSMRLMCFTRGMDWRFCANACAVSLPWFRDRWVT